QSNSLAPGRILESPQLDDGTGRRVTGRVKIGQAHMVGASVYTVDHGVRCPLQLVVETARDQPSDDRLGRILAAKRKVSDIAFDALVGESSVDAPDDVVALAQRPHHGLSILRQMPSCRTERLGEAKALQFLHTADHDGARISIRSGAGAGPEVYNPTMLGGLSREYAVEVGPT